MAMNRRAALGLIGSFAAAPAISAPRSRLIDSRWARFGTSAGPSHDQWRDILARGRKLGSDGIARFDYGGINPNEVSAYVREIAALDPSTFQGHAAFAYWVNLYNAATVELVQSAYPVSSIRKIGGVFSGGPWGKSILTVNGQDLSLDDIEHGILRPVWKDARIHYVVNCASLGCPNLDAKPFSAKAHSQRLDRAARDFINHPRAVQVSGSDVVLSSLYDWYGSDFGGNSTEILQHIAGFAEKPLREALRGVRRIRDYRYDWALNDV